MDENINGKCEKECYLERSEMLNSKANLLYPGKQ